MRLQKSLQPAPIRYGLVVEVGTDGEIIRSFHDPSGEVAIERIPMFAIEEFPSPSWKDSGCDVARALVTLHTCQRAASTQRPNSGAPVSSIRDAFG